MKKPRFRAFTLIELLVVIAIIAILAAILFPVFAKARDRAKTTACINNMKQISIAFLGYFQDYDETFPPYTGYVDWSIDDGPGSKMGWCKRIYPQIRNLDVFRCPANGVSNFCYGMNYLSTVRAPDLQNGGFTAGIGTISRVKNPAKFIHLFEIPGTGNPALPKISWAGQKWPNGDCDPTNDDQKEGHVYGYPTGFASGDLATKPQARAEPISKVRDDILTNRATQRPGHLYFPGWHSDGNNFMFLDGHVHYYNAWNPDSMTLEPTTP